MTIAVAMVLVLAIPGYSQRLMGLVVQKNTQGVDEPLPGANVYWLGTQVATTTGENGVFLIDRVPGSDRLVVSFTGFVSDTVEATDQTSVKVVLKDQQYLEAVTVEGWRPTTGLDHTRAINTSVMTEKELFKAACCNLSESFETNPAVDVAFTDAVTGTRQIQMLGLAGPNTMISIENMPALQGLAASQGIQFIPGTWINSIEVTKGVGSVVNGYESIAGQINVELKKPQESEKLFINGYVNQSGRSELNTNYTAMAGDKWATTFLLHGSVRPFEMDNNGDRFLDFPVGNQWNIINRWVYNSGKGLLGQFGIKVLEDNKRGGQKGFDPETDKFSTNRYGLEIDTRRWEAWGKLGYQFPGQPYKSVGLQLSALRHQHESYYGLTQHQADENRAYANLIYQSIIGSTFHKFKTGLSFTYLDHGERVRNDLLPVLFRDETGVTSVNEAYFDRVEAVPGAFVEYTYSPSEKVTVVAGVRLDYHNLFGWIFTPRLHSRFNVTETSTLRLSAGKGVRVASPLIENTGVLVSQRQLVFSGRQTDKAYGFEPDRAWNYGLNFSQDFNLDYRPGTFTLDYFYTNFQNQLVTDLDYSARQANFFGLTGKSYSHSLQAQIDYELMRRLDVRLAYRWLNVETDFLEGRRTRPLIAGHRAFANLAYETRNNWKFDYTVQWLGKQRLPQTEENPPAFQLGSNSKPYWVMNAQVTKDFRDDWSVYLGVENIGNFKLDDPIIASAEPFSPYFDASLVYGPVFGRMAYAGFRYRIK